MQFNIKKILLIVVVILTLGLAYKYYKKVKDTGKIKTGELTLKASNKIDTFGELAEIFQKGILLKGNVQIRNFSSNDYQINQVKIDAFTPKTQNKVAEQINILQNQITVKAKQETLIPIKFKLDAVNALTLFKECEVIPTDTTLWYIATHPLEIFKKIELKNLKVLLKGFIEAEGITLDINKEQLLYD
jgi:hypothetical protein